MNPIKEREQRGLEIAALLPIKRNGETFIVPSQTNGKTYKVDATPDESHCNCPDFEKRQEKCKHIFAVECVIRREESYHHDGERRNHCHESRNRQVAIQADVARVQQRSGQRKDSVPVPALRTLFGH
jgi:hypothetical protein